MTDDELQAICDDADVNVDILLSVKDLMDERKVLWLDDATQQLSIDRDVAKRCFTIIINEYDVTGNNEMLVGAPPLLRKLCHTMNLDLVQVMMQWDKGAELIDSLATVLDGSLRGKPLKQRLIQIQEDWEPRLPKKIWKLYMYLAVEQYTIHESVSDARYTLKKAKEVNENE